MQQSATPALPHPELEPVFPGIAQGCLPLETPLLVGLDPLGRAAPAVLYHIPVGIPDGVTSPEVPGGVPRVPERKPQREALPGVNWSSPASADSVALGIRAV